MKDFFKFTLATVTGIILSAVVLFFLSILVLFSALSASESETQVKENSIFTLKLNGTLSERSQENPFDFFTKDVYTQYGLDDILTAIKKAKENDHIKGIYIQATMFSAGPASLTEIRQTLQDFKESGKFIVAYSDTYTQGLYYLSSVADKVLLNPKGNLEWRGVLSQPTFYKELLDKLGIEMQIFKVGTYKSAVEPYVNTEMSEANREQINDFLQSIWNNMLKDVSASRQISIDSLNLLANEMQLLRPAETYVENGLVDSLIYKNDVNQYLKTLAGIDEDDDLRTLGLKEMLNVQKNQPKDKSGNIIAIYYAYGGIDDSEAISGGEGISSNKVIKDLHRLQEDDDVKAVVLRINSPGGSAFGSEQIWYAVEQLKKKKPVIVSMGDYAASGGYYMSCNADTIVAQPTTLTGSIGIFGMMPIIDKLTDKIGLNFQVVKTNTFADFGDITRPMTEGEKVLMQNYINQGYDLFLTRCSDGRGIDKATLDNIAQGRVWIGETAKELGLVDVLGGLNTAIDIAITKAGVEHYTLMSYPRKESFYGTLLNSDIETLLTTKLLKGKVGDMAQQINFINQIEGIDCIQARMPFEPNIK